MERKKAKIIRKTETGAWPGHMLKQQTMPVDVCPKAPKFFQRKMAKSERVLATKALANKLTKATYYIMRDQVAYDSEKLFG